MKAQKPKKTKEPKKLAEVADQITDLVETAQQAETLAEDNQEMAKTLKEQAKALDMAKAEAEGYAAMADGITEQDIQNLQTLWADVSFRVRSTTGQFQVKIQGTGRRRIGVTAPTLREALIALRPLMAKVPR